jgi:hypothetical protein
MSRTNSLQAVLAREAAHEPATPALAPKQEPSSEKFYRPSRDGRRFLGGHFDPKVVRQMKMLAAEEDTTTQALLEEALDMLFIKKGRGRIIRG